MGPDTLAVVCAWCNRTVTNAPDGAPMTHTICRSCADWTFTHHPLPFPDEDYIDLPPREVVRVTKH